MLTAVISRLTAVGTLSIHVLYNFVDTVISTHNEANELFTITAERNTLDSVVCFTKYDVICNCFRSNFNDKS